MLGFRRLITKRIPIYAFSNLETYGIKRLDAVQDIKSITYVPKQKLVFDKKGSCLLYLYQPFPLRYTLQNMKYVIPAIFVASLIRNNPCILFLLINFFSQKVYATFPAFLPIMFLVETFILVKLYRNMMYQRNTVYEIRLRRDGMIVEIEYEKQFWRKLKEETIIEPYFIPTLKNPLQGPSYQPMTGNVFPTEFPPVLEKSQIQWSFKKHFMNPANYYVLPTNCNYINWEILIHVFKGMLIDTSKSNIEVTEDDWTQLAIKGELKFEPYVKIEELDPEIQKKIKDFRQYVRYMRQNVDEDPRNPEINEKKL